MYLEHFGLKKDPFKLDPSLDFVFVSTGHEEAIAHLVYGIEQGESFVLITGGIGTGKTLALHFLLDQIVSSFKTAFINVTQINFLELLKLILDDLEIPFDRNGDRADLLHTLKLFLLATRDKREKVLVVVDEAQELSLETLEALRLLSNLTQPGEQILQIVIAGQPGLAKLIAAPELEQLRQRIRVRYELETLSKTEIGPYIQHRLVVAGCNDSPFSQGALQRIFELSGGVPRLVNYEADRALLAAYVDNSAKIKVHHVEDEDEDESGVSEVVEEEPRGPALPEEPERPIESGSILKSSTTRAMSAMKDVDLDEIRDSRPASRPVAATRKSQKKFPILWVIFPILLVAGAWYAYTQTDLLQSFLDGQAVTTEPEVLTQVETPPQQELISESLVREEPVISEPDLLQAVEDDIVVEQEIVPAATAVPVLGPEFALHVSSFHNMEKANRHLSSFQDAGLEVFIKDTAVGGERWFRLFVGPYDSRDFALAVGQDLKQKGVIEYFLVTKQTQN